MPRMDLLFRGSRDWRGSRASSLSCLRRLALAFGSDSTTSCFRQIPNHERSAADREKTVTQTAHVPGLSWDIVSDLRPVSSERVHPNVMPIRRRAKPWPLKSVHKRDDPKATEEGALTVGAAGAMPTGTPSTVTSLPGSDAWIDLGGGNGPSDTYKTLSPWVTVSLLRLLISMLESTSDFTSTTRRVSSRVPRAVMDCVARAAQKSDDEFGVHVNKIKAHFIDSDKVAVG